MDKQKLLSFLKTNTIIVIVYSALVALYLRGSSDKSLGVAVIQSVVTTVHIVVLLLVVIFTFLRGKNYLGKTYLWGTLIMVGIGAGLCFLHMLLATLL